MKIIKVFIIGLFYSVTFAFANTEPPKQEQPKLGIEFDATWVSKYMWHGMDLYDDHAAFQPSLNFDLFDTGFSINVFNSTACGSGFVQDEELDYSLAYQNSIFNEKRFQTDFEISWLYYDYYRMSSDEADSQELDMSLSWPEVFSFGLTPSYALSYLYSATSNSPAAKSEMEGFSHTFGLAYDCNIPKTDLPLTLSWDITYNDGQGGSDIDHDWSYMTWGISTSLEAGPGCFTPAVYYQTSMEDTVNNEDEFWASLSYTFGF